MDLPLLCTDGQRQKPSSITDGETEDADLHLQSSAEETSSAPEPRTECVSQHSDSSGKSPLHVHKCLPHENSTNSEALTSSWCDYDLSQCLPVCSKTSKDDDFRVHCCLSSSESTLPLLPQISRDLFSPHSETFSEFHVEKNLSRTQKNSSSEYSEGLIDSFTTEAFSSHNFSAGKSQAASIPRSLSPQSDSLESDTAAAAPLSELYIFESDTQDFILSPVEIKCPEYHLLPQTQERSFNYESDTHAPMCHSTDIVTQCHHSSSEECDTEINESGLRLPATHAWDAGSLLGNNAWQGKAEAEGLTSQSRSNDSPVELWLDACQYLAGEDTENPYISDETNYAVMQSGVSADLSFFPGETPVSDCDPDGSDGIGWSGDDTRGRGPRVERWSSVDSWASALSDWTGIIEAPPEDITAAFTEIGAEIDALTQALAEVTTPGDQKGHHLETTGQAQPHSAMGVQDQPMKEQNIPQSTFHSSQSCLLCLEAPGFELCDRSSSQSEESLCDSTQEEKYPKESESSPHTTPKYSFMGSSDVTVGCLGGYGTDIPGSTSYSGLDVSQFDGYITSLETDIFVSKRDPVTLNITEDTDLDSPAKTFGDGLCEVTDDCSIPKEDWSCCLAEKSQPAEYPEFFTAHSPTGSRVPGVDTQPGQHINVHTHLPFDTLPDLDGACQVEPQSGSPKFIMPLAPLSIGSSLVCRTSNSLEGDQTFAKRHLNDRGLSCELLRRCTVLPASDGITGKPSQESEELIHQKENKACTAEKPSEADTLTSDAVDCFLAAEKTTFKEITDFNRQLDNLTEEPGDHLFISRKNHIACITLNLNDPFTYEAATPIYIAVQTEKQKATPNMPHKTHRGSAENKSRSKKDRSTGHHHGAQASKKQDNVSHIGSTQQTCKKHETHPATAENHNSENTAAGLEVKVDKLVIDTDVLNNKGTTKVHGKKKKKHGQTAVSGVSLGEPLIEVENGAKPKTVKGRIDHSEARLDVKAQKDSDQSDGVDKKAQPEVKVSQGEAKPPQHTDHKDHQPKKITSPLKDDAIKRRRLSEDKFGRILSALESKLPGTSAKVKVDEPKADVGVNCRKAYSEVVKQKIPPKEELKVVQPIQAVSVSGDPQSLCLWCQFAAVFSEYTVTWSREGTVLAELKRSAGDESRVSVTITNASHKDLGKYQCRLSTVHGSLTLDYVLTYEVLSEIVIPLSPKIVSTAPVELVSDEEDVQFSKLMFKEDFLSDQYFGENKPISILTEKAHFGEGMHRRAFRTKLHGGQIPLLVPGHPCVLKVHNAISYGTKNNEELIQKNFTLAVEECHVQNTARQYIKAYTTAAQSIEAFGEVPEIIPIYLVHRPSNDIPYATLEEELIGDFVKYSVKDGKEINLMRRDSEAGQKCCAFQHWVYQKTEGNLLVTDMQGVGMRLTDVGIATCKKGYKGFKGNCSTSFIDQFKALHQCNFYCELLELKSLQPKPKKPAAAPKPKPQLSALPKKKTFGPTLKGKSEKGDNVGQKDLS